ncbi:hypothetical protein SAMN05444285_1671, partial [Draconibacterium orientale]
FCVKFKMAHFAFKIYYHILSYLCYAFSIVYNGHLQVVVADFEERQRPQDEDGQERSGDNAHHEPRNAICNLLAPVVCFHLLIHLLFLPSPSK